MTMTDDRQHASRHHERVTWYSRALHWMRLRDSPIIFTERQQMLSLPAPSSVGTQSPFSGVKSVSGADAVSRQQSGKAVTDGMTVDKAVNEGMKSSVWVYACVAKLAASIASLPLVVKDNKGDLMPDSPLQLLLDSPNEFWSQQDLMERVAGHLMLTGNAIIAENRGEGRKSPAPVLELWTVKPDMIKPVPSSTDFISHYELNQAGIKRVIPASDIIHIQLTDPSNMFWGMSPLIAAAATVETEKAAVNWNRVSLQNRAVADGMLSFGADLTREQWLEARFRLRQQHMGADNARVPFVFGNQATWRSISMTPVEMDFIESRRMTREEICAVFGVPPILVGILDSATYSNFETARSAFWSDTIVPLMRNLTDAMTLAFRRDFGDVVVDFDSSSNEVLSAVKADVVAIAQQLWSMGVPFEQLNDRLRLGFQPFAGWQQSYLPSSVVPAEILSVDQFALSSSGNDPDA